jgi:nitrogenase molybdenum-iron protein NifN
MEWIVVFENQNKMKKNDINTGKAYTSTRNACKLCAPLGASLVFKGIEGCVPMIHGSQGCSTYIRRYIISHFREPIDIASSNFSEETTVFGGNRNFCTGIENIISQYQPQAIGIASTCLSETIGEDIPMLIKEFKGSTQQERIPVFVHASTPSYQGSHMEGFQEAVLSTIKSLARKDAPGTHINLFSGMISPEDIRYVKEIMQCFELPVVLFPDYSDTLDNPTWGEYQLVPEGGTPLSSIANTANAMATIEFRNSTENQGEREKKSRRITAGRFLEKEFQISCLQTGLPIGIGLTDAFFGLLEKLSGKPTPQNIDRERGRLVDAYVDGHKYLFGKRAIVYGEEDLVVSLVSFLEEIGIETVLAGSGGESGKMDSELQRITGGKYPQMKVMSGVDFETINELADDLKPDIMIGNSKGYYISRRLGIPLIRVGFPVHDRFGGQRIQLLGYKGTQQLFDRIVNALMEYKQEHSPIGYKYI